jgi:hypothetical protein
MNENELFQAALGLLPPWLVERCTFDETGGAWTSILIFLAAACFHVRFARQATAKPATLTV